MVNKIIFILYILVLVCMAAATIVEKSQGTDYAHAHYYGACLLYTSDYPPQEYPGKTGYQERFFAHHLCRDARICGYQQDLTLRGIPKNDDATLSHTYI